MSLIHESTEFSSERILEKSQKYGFPNPVAVEMFLWDIEISAQLQREDDRLILKGGAAAQLFLPVDKQRGSTDIDMKALPSITEAEISSIVSRVEERLPTVRFEKYTPMVPNPKLPLVTYSISIPSALQSTGQRTLEIKADILLEDPGLPSAWVERRLTFALEVGRMRIPTLGVCIGDKLLTLAKGTIGMTKEEDYPKQMYDIDLLSGSISPETFGDIVNAVEKLTPLEASFRDLKTVPPEALQCINILTTSYAAVDTSNADLNQKKHIQGFQSFLVGQNQVLPLFKWASRALRIRFLATLVELVLEGKMRRSEATDKLRTADRIAESLDKVPGPSVNENRQAILKMITSRIPYFKFLRSKSLSRVFWEAASPTNLETIAGLITS